MLHGADTDVGFLPDDGRVAASRLHRARGTASGEGPIESHPIPFHAHPQRLQDVLRSEARGCAEPLTSLHMKLAMSRVARREQFPFDDRAQLTGGLAGVAGVDTSAAAAALALTIVRENHARPRSIFDDINSNSAANLSSIVAQEGFGVKKLRRRLQSALDVVDELGRAGYDLGELYLAQIRRDGTTPHAFCVANGLALSDFERWLRGDLTVTVERAEQIRKAVAEYVAKTFLRGEGDEATMKVHLASRQQAAERQSLLEPRRDVSGIGGGDPFNEKDIRKLWRQQTQRDGLSMPQFCELFSIHSFDDFHEWFENAANFAPEFEAVARDYLEMSHDLRAHFLQTCVDNDERVEDFCRRRMLPVGDVTAWLSGRDTYSRSLVRDVWEYVMAHRARAGRRHDFSNHPPLLQWVFDTESPWAMQRPAALLPRIQHPFQSHKRAKRDEFVLEQVIGRLTSLDAGGDVDEDEGVIPEDPRLVKKKLHEERKKGLSRHDNESVAAETPFDPHRAGRHAQRHPHRSVSDHGPVSDSRLALLAGGGGDRGNRSIGGPPAHPEPNPTNGAAVLGVLASPHAMRNIGSTPQQIDAAQTVAPPLPPAISAVDLLRLVHDGKIDGGNAARIREKIQQDLAAEPQRRKMKEVRQT